MRFLFITHGVESLKRPGPHWVPLGFAYIGALLKKQGHVVQIFDCHAAMARLGPDWKKIDQAMLTTMKTFSPDVIGMTTISPLVYQTVHCAKILRDSFQGIMLAGGHHATALPQLTLEKIPELDGVCIGEGEEALLALAEGTNKDQIKEILWRNKSINSEEKKTGEGLKPGFGRIKNLDTLPFPDYSLLDISFYTRRTSAIIRGFYLSTLTMLGSRGCSYRCSFCTESLVYGGGVRFHSVDYLTEMVGRTLKQFPRVEAIYFHDNDFMFDRARVEHICHQFIKTGLAKKFSWAIQARADRLQPDLLRLMRQAGCIKIEIGVEATAQKDLDYLRKDTTVGTNENALRFCREAGISVHAYVLTQTAGESLTDLESKLDWLKRNRPDTFMLMPLARHPGSILYQESGGNFFETKEWTRENVLNFYEEDVFSKVPPREREIWIKSRLAPFSRNHFREVYMRLNPMKKWPPMWHEIIMYQLKGRNVNLPSRGRLISLYQ